MSLGRAAWVLACAVSVALPAWADAPHQRPEAFPSGPEPNRPAEDAGTPPETGAETWRVALGAEGAALFDGKSGAAVVTARADWYLTPLIDWERYPLALLTFIEHPDTLSLFLGNDVNGFGGTVTASLYPWKETGLLASVRLDDDPGSGTWSFAPSAFVQDYFQHDLRGRLGYVGSRTWAPAEYTARDGVQASLDWLVGRVLLSARVDVAAIEQDFESGGVSQFSFLRGGRLSATYYIDRRWSVALFGDASYTTFNDVSTGSIATESIGASGEVYVTTSLYVLLTVQPHFQQTHLPPGMTVDPNAPFTAVDPVVQDVSLQLVYRR